jgi:two-component system response regulator HydG
MSDRPLPPSSDLPGPHDRAAQSPAMRHLWSLAACAAPTASTVLITGESGVGKERVAQWLHAASPRATAPFEPVDCAALPETLFETALFGHARGAFTGAGVERPGLFEKADRGTLFLDEIGEVSLAMQAKLLRVIQEGELRRVGETQVRRVNVRLLAATNRDLRKEVRLHRFRKDLYYRLDVIKLHVPPLRARQHDLPILIDQLLTRAATRHNRPIIGCTPAVLHRLLTYDWPGNVRELEHALERACAVATGRRIDVDDLPETIRHVRLSRRAVQPLRDLEREYILNVVARVGNLRRAAKELRISLATLTRRLHAYRRPSADPSTPDSR